MSKTILNTKIFSKNSSSGSIASGITAIVANYSALPNVSTESGKFYWVSSTQGTSWLPGTLGGTFYNSGLYYSNGVTWEFLNSPYQATQATVNTGTNTDQFVTPSTLANSTLLSNKKDFYSLSNSLESGNPADATTYYVGSRNIALGSAATTTDGIQKIYIPKTGTLTYARVTFTQAAGASNQTSTIYVRLNSTTDTVISSSVTNDSTITSFSNSALNIAVTEGDFVEIKWITPTWGTNPTGVNIIWQLLIQTTQ